MLPPPFCLNLFSYKNVFIFSGASIHCPPLGCQGRPQRHRQVWLRGQGQPPALSVLDQGGKRSTLQKPVRNLSWSPLGSSLGPAVAVTINSPWSFVTAERDDISPKWIIDFLMDRNWKSLPKKYFNWQTFANARCQCRFRSIKYCRNYKNEIKLANLLIWVIALTDILTQRSASNHLN